MTWPTRINFAFLKFLFKFWDLSEVLKGLCYDIFKSSSDVKKLLSNCLIIFDIQIVLQQQICSYKQWKELTLAFVEFKRFLLTTTVSSGPLLFAVLLSSWANGERQNKANSSY